MKESALFILFGWASAFQSQKRFLPFNSTQEPGTFLDEVIDDDGNVQHFKMAPKPGYSLPFDHRSDELLIMTELPEGNDATVSDADADDADADADADADDADADDADAAGNGKVIKAEFWNVGGDRFNTNTCKMTLIDVDSDTYYDSFTIAEDPDNCKDYGGK